MISVIIPLYNAEKSILTALDSIKNQTGNFDFEIVVINDGSTDSSFEVVQKYTTENPQLNIILLNQPNQGVSSARNAGFKKAKGEFIALLDSDDEWLPEKTQKQMQLLETLEIHLIASARNNAKILFPYRLNKDQLAPVTFNMLLLRNEIHPSTVIFRKNVLEKAGYFNPDQRYAEDVFFFLKVAMHFKMYIFGESLVIAGGGKRTFGVSGLSANLKEMKKGFQQNVKELEKQGIISHWKGRFLHLFYELKYHLLVLRKSYYQKTEKK